MWLGLRALLTLSFAVGRAGTFVIKLAVVLKFVHGLMKQYMSTLYSCNDAVSVMRGVFD